MRGRPTVKVLKGPRQGAAVLSPIEHGIAPLVTVLYQVASNVYAMRLVLIDVRAAIAVASAAILPFVLVWLSAIPAKTIIEDLVGLIA
jgi:hypothetical protein